MAEDGMDNESNRTELKSSTPNSALGNLLILHKGGRKGDLVDVFRRGDT